MKTKIAKTLISCLVILAGISLNLRAQIGVDNPAPDPYSILDLKASDKGILVPRMTTASRFSIRTDCNPSCPEGLLVYDTDLQSFFYMRSNTWYALTPFSSPDAAQGSAEDISTNTNFVGDVGIGISPAAGYKLHVAGKGKLDGGLDIDGDLTLATGNLAVTLGDITAPQGDMTTTNGDIKTTNGKMVVGVAAGASNFSSDGASNFAGPVPRGGIIMWSGATVPTGWSLCDGSNGTPDLTGRMVIGKGTRPELIRNAAGTIEEGDNKTFALNTTLGADQIILDVSEMPAHVHNISMDYGGSHNHDTYFDDGGGSCDGCPASHVTVSSVSCSNCGANGSKASTTNGSHDHDLYEDTMGGDDKSYNMPPYYVLAFIMKL